MSSNNKKSIVKGKSKYGKNFGVDIFHPNLYRKVPPQSVAKLASLLQEPQNKDIHDASIKGHTFSDCLGIIAAMLDIALDGNYDVPDLCDLLVRGILARGSLGNSPQKLDSRLISADLVERETEIELIESSGTLAPLTQKEIEIRGNSIFLQTQGCMICNQISLCKGAGKCLGNTTEVHEEAVKQKGRILQ